MKWCLLLNSAGYMAEFLGKLSYQIMEQGDECIILANSKIAIWDKKKYFHNDVKIFSKPDWCRENYRKDWDRFNSLSWKEFFPTFDRMTRFGFSKFDYDYSVELVSQLFQFVDFVFKKERPDLVIQEPPANVFNEIVYHLCKKNGIVYLGLTSSRFEGRIDIYDLGCSCSRYKKDFKKMYDKHVDVSEEDKKFAQNFIASFINHKQLPSYMKAEGNYFYKINLMKYYIKRARYVWKPRFRYLLSRRQWKQFDYESEAILKSTFYAPYNAVKRKVRIFLLKNIFDSFNSAKDYFLFPLHLQPEASTSVQATYFCDQLNTIKNIGFSLPFPYKLYVKEHPSAIGTRPKTFYKELKKIPNVFLVSPFESVKNLVKKSSGIITLTSTIGMEAALFGKPVYVLGDVFYSYHPLCKRIKNFKELHQVLQNDLINKVKVHNLEDINIWFILSYFRNTIPGDLISATSEKDTNDYALIYKEIKKYFLENN